MIDRATIPAADLLAAGCRRLLAGIERESGLEGLEQAVAPLAISGAEAFAPGLEPLLERLAPLGPLVQVLINAGRPQPPAQGPVDVTPRGDV